MRSGPAVAHEGGARGRVDQGVEGRAERSQVAPELRLDGGTARAALHRSELRGEPGHELELHREAHQRLEVGQGVRGRVVELSIDQLDVAVDETCSHGTKTSRNTTVVSTSSKRAERG